MVPGEKPERGHGIVGVSIAIIEDGEIRTAKGYGFTDKSAATRVTTNTLFQAGSVSKPVAALAALRMVEDRRLRPVVGTASLEVKS